MIAAIHQPNYLPWTGYFHRMVVVDTFVFFDHVQFPRGKSWGSRNKIRLNDREMWLTVPIKRSGRGLERFDEVEINYASDWKRKHLGTLRQAYGKAAYYDAYEGELASIYASEPKHLADLNLRLIRFVADKLGIRAEFVRSSTLNLPSETGTRAIVDVCQAIGCSTYVSGTGCLDFLEPAMFEQAGIELQFQHYVHPEYGQQGGGFMSHLCALDLLFNRGPAGRDVMLHGNLPGRVSAEDFFRGLGSAAPGK